MDTYHLAGQIKPFFAECGNIFFRHDNDMLHRPWRSHSALVGHYYLRYRSTQAITWCQRFTTAYLIQCVRNRFFRDTKGLQSALWLHEPMKMTERKSKLILRIQVTENMRTYQSKHKITRRWSQAKYKGRRPWLQISAWSELPSKKTSSSAW